MRHAYDACVDAVVRAMGPVAGPKWFKTLRPTVHLCHGHDRVEAPLVGRIGGLPDLPEEIAWPLWEGHGPLTHYASIDCAAMPVHELDIPVPAEGTLLFFRYAATECAFAPTDESFVRPREESHGAAKATVIHVPAGVTTCPRSAPRGLTVLDEISLRRFEPVLAPPADGHVCLHDADITDTSLFDAEDELELLSEISYEQHNGLWPHIGGHARPVQCCVEVEISRTLLGGSCSEEEHFAEQRRWTMLASFDEGDAADLDGVVYWMIRREDLANRRFDRILLVCQR